ncbi:hypothetical protein OG828_21600 [Streptomyces sp. NBC_00457]|uniref:hypothetical protein n=1 Tax=Streptomyces sp. NBC_00457 TaxID=2975748 RepID=UPI002E1A4813
MLRQDSLDLLDHGGRHVGQALGGRDVVVAEAVGRGPEAQQTAEFAINCLMQKGC